MEYFLYLCRLYARLCTRIRTTYMDKRPHLGHILRWATELLAVLLLSVSPIPIAAQNLLKKQTTQPSTQKTPEDKPATSTLPPTLQHPADSTSLQGDSAFFTTDSVAAINQSNIKDSTSLPRISDKLDAQIDYTSDDSLVMWGNGAAYLYGKGDITYKDINLTADYIRVKIDSSTIYSAGVYDSITEEWHGRPVFKQGEDSYESYEMSYNLQTKRAFVRHVVTEQGEGYIIADKTKIMDNGDMMMAGGKYTTCDDHDHPHFYLQITKGKLRPGKNVTSGPAYLVVGDVPLPIAVPFAFFPMTNTYSSGLIMPNFGDDQTRGMYLQGLGYYFAINDYVDLNLTGDIYTNGSWSLKAQSRYRLRYKFSGNISASYISNITGEKGMPDFTKSNNFQLTWSHTQDSKANPYSTFSASVNFSTSGYNRADINSYYDPSLNSQNTKASSISYTQRFPDSPWSLSMSASISQQTRDSTMSLKLPEFTLNLSQTKPFKRKKPVGKERWYEKISLRYTFQGGISVQNIKEKEILHSNFLRDWKSGFKHSLPVSASFNLFKYINISPNITYNEAWMFQRVDQSWDELQNQVVRDTTYGFYRVWDLSMSVSASTKLYGIFIPSRKLFPNSRVDRFRHVFSPSISFSYTPDCEPIRAKLNHNYYGSYIKPSTNTAGEVVYQTIEYNRFQGGKYGTPSKGNVGSINFSLANNLEMKVFNRKDTTGKEPTKIISLIDNFTISGGYNFLADSMNWSNFNTTLRIKLPKPLNYTINLAGSWDPYLYALNEFGKPVRTNRRCWQEGKFLHFKGTSTSFSYTFNNEVFRKWFGKERKKKEEKFDPGWDMDDPYAIDPNTGELITDEQREEAELAKKQWEKEHKEEPAADLSDWDFAEIPWSLTLSYSLRYGESNEFDYNKMNYKMRFTHNLSANISLGLGKGWRASTSLSYDFANKKLSNATINVTRNLHCWTMTASFVPFGPLKSYNFHIGVNASMLSDLKYDKSSADATNNHINWW